MDSTHSEFQYVLEYIASALASNLPDADRRWQELFDEALHNWQLTSAQQILRLVKSYPTDQVRRYPILYREGSLFVQVGEWNKARNAYQRVRSLAHELGDRKAEMAALNALANLLRRMEQPSDEIAALLQRALTLADSLVDLPGHAAILNNLGLAHYSAGRLAEAATCYNDALITAQTHHLTALEASIQHNLGSLRWTQGQLAAAEKYFNQSRVLLQTLGDLHGEAETLNSFGLLLEARGDWHSAQSTYVQSLNLLQQSGDLYGQVQVLTNLGNLSWLQGDYAQSLTHHEQALAIAEDLGDVKLQGQVLTGLGDTYRILNRPDEAEQAFLAALAHKQAAGDQRSLKHTYLNLGSFYHTRNQFGQATAAYQQALRLAQQQHDTRIEAFTLLNLGKLAALQGNIHAANAHLDVADRIALKAEYWDCLADACRVRGDLELLQPEPDALRLVQLYTEACVHAANFNQKLLEAMIDYLVTFWTAHAEDGYADQTIWFCDSIIACWHEVGHAAQHPSLIRGFENLKAILV